MANKILDRRFNNGLCRISMYIDEKNHAVFSWNKITSIDNQFSKLEIEEYCKSVNRCVIAAEALSQVWRIIGEKQC